MKYDHGRISQLVPGEELDGEVDGGLRATRYCGLAWWETESLCQAPGHPSHTGAEAMSIHTPDGREGAGERFEYFMVRLTRFEGDPDRMSGMIERLGSGEKRTFNTGEHLVQLVGAWSNDLNMTPGTDHRNAVRTGSDGSATSTGV